MKTFFYFSFIPFVWGWIPLSKPRSTHISPMSSRRLIMSSTPFLGKVDKVSMGTLLKDIDEKNVENIYFSSDLQRVFFEELTPVPGSLPKKVVQSNAVLTDKIITLAEKQNIDTMIMDQPVASVSNIVQGAISILDFLFWPALILLSLQIFARNSGGMGPSSTNIGSGNSGSNMPFFMPGQNNRLNKDKIEMIKANVSLASWAGSPEIFEECTEIVSYLKNNTIYRAAGAEIPKGILLEGPPGTGKTLIAKAIASETDANFISVSASEFIELFVGLGAAKVRNLFKLARENKPTIIFIDEIDAVGRQRGAGINMGNDEREQTLNQLLAEMDGFSPNDGVLVIAATNRKDILDAALLRPGRFDRLINVPLPDKPSRISILNVHMKNKQFEPEVNVDFLAELTGGFSGAQLKNLINEAAIHAARKGNVVISQENLNEALEKLVVGLVKKVDTRGEAVLERVAYHELGHAFLADYFHQYFELKKVTIQSTYNGAGGYTLFGEYPEIMESGLYTKDLLKKRLIIALGGKAAEYVFYGEEQISLGAIQDLKQANSLAQQMIGNYGMGKELEVFYNENVESGRNPFLGRSMAMGDKYSEKTKEKMDMESLELVNEAYLEALAILRANKLGLVCLKDELVKRTTISGPEFNKLVKKYVYESDINTIHNNKKYVYESDINTIHNNTTNSRL